MTRYEAEDRADVSSPTPSRNGAWITLGVRDLDGGEVSTCTARYVAGCDGSRSFVRRAAGIGMPRGEPLGKLWGVFFECDEVLARWPTDRDPTWMNFIFHPNRGGALIAIDGIRRWLAHVNVPRGVDHKDVDFEAGVLELVGLDAPMAPAKVDGSYPIPSSRA